MASTQPGEADVAIDHQHQQETDHHEHEERRKDKDARAFLVIAAIVAIIAAIVGAYLLSNREPAPPGPQPAPTTAQRAVDEAAALETVEQFTAADDAAIAAKSIGPELKDLGSPNLIQNTQDYIDNMVRGGHTQTGEAKIVSAKVTSWDNSQLGYRVTTVLVCADISGVTMVDPTGAEVPSLNPDGSPMIRTRLPVKYFVHSRPDGSYFVDSTQPNPDVTATC
jgi:hypothetical protein